MTEIKADESVPATRPTIATTPPPSRREDASRPTGAYLSATERVASLAPAPCVGMKRERTDVIRIDEVASSATAAAGTAFVAAASASAAAAVAAAGAVTAVAAVATESVDEGNAAAICNADKKRLARYKKKIASLTSCQFAQLQTGFLQRVRIRILD